MKLGTRSGATRTIVAIAFVGAALAAASSAAPPGESARRTPVVRAVEKVAPATVNITTEFRVSRPSPFFRPDPFFNMFFEQAPDLTDQTLGTGVIVDPAGYVLTNEHVLAGAEKIWVSLVDGREFRGTLIGADPETDLAVLKIEGAEQLPVAPLARDGDLLIGETVVAIGNPFGLNHTVTTGVLSAINRSFRADQTEYHGFLQTDASINPGNSGGPLLNLDGELIGINTAIFREAEGIGFAIPVDRARRIMDDLIDYGEVIPVWLGLRLQDLTPGLRQMLEVRTGSGALVQSVFAGSPAERAGVKVGDVLIALQGSQVQSPRNYFEILRGITQSDTARLRIERAGQTVDIDAIAEQMPASITDEVARLMLGFSLRPMNARESELYGRAGMVIDQLVPGSLAARRLLPGDVIWAIDRDALVDPDTYRKSILKLRGRQRALLLVQRGRDRARLALSLS